MTFKTLYQQVTNGTANKKDPEVDVILKVKREQIEANRSKLNQIIFNHRSPFYYGKAVKNDFDEKSVNAYKPTRFEKRFNHRKVGVLTQSIINETERLRRVEIALKK